MFIKLESNDRDLAFKTARGIAYHYKNLIHLHTASKGTLSFDDVIRANGNVPEVGTITDIPKDKPIYITIDDIENPYIIITDIVKESYVGNEYYFNSLNDTCRFLIAETFSNEFVRGLDSMTTFEIPNIQCESIIDMDERTEKVRYTPFVALIEAVDTVMNKGK